MKKTVPLLVTAIAVTLFCCRDLRNLNSFPSRPELLNRTSVTSQHHVDESANAFNKAEPEEQNLPPDSVYPYSPKDSLSPTKQVRSQAPAIAQTTKRIRKAIRKNGGDDDTGIAIGILVLLVLLGAAILVLLIWLIVASTSQAASQSSSNSGSNSNSGNGGNGGGSSGNGGSGSGSGCYIATMVYGDYDAPEVMVLRKFRDEKLAHSKAGRAFINWYYSWSPRFVKRYSHLRYVHCFAKFFLDRFVKLLSK